MAKFGVCIHSTGSRRVERPFMREIGPKSVVWPRRPIRSKEVEPKIRLVKTSSESRLLLVSHLTFRGLGMRRGYVHI